jgi:hypothetical protein
METHMMSLNVQGFSTCLKRVMLRTLLDQFKPGIDIMCAQEHMLIEKEKRTCKKEVWKDSLSITSPAIDGCRAQANLDVTAGK